MTDLGRPLIECPWCREMVGLRRLKIVAHTPMYMPEGVHCPASDLEIHRAQALADESFMRHAATGE